MDAVFVFSRASLIFKLIVCGLICSIVESTLVVGFLYMDLDSTANSILSVFVALFWFLMIQITTILHVKRISSMGYYMWFDKYMRYLPLVIGCLEVPTVVCIILDGFNVIPMNEDGIAIGYYDIFSILFAGISILVELILYWFLYLKLKFILEYNPNLLSKLIFHINVMLGVIVITEVAIIVAKSCHTVLDLSIRPLTQLLRIYVIIQFYSDLILGIDTDMHASDSKRSFHQLV